MLDRRGTQYFPSVTYRNTGTQSIFVPNREYFKRSRDGRLWSTATFITCDGREACDGKSTCDSTCQRKATDDVRDRKLPPSFFLQRIITLDHGWPLTALSVRLTEELCDSLQGELNQECKKIIQDRENGPFTFVVLKRFQTFLAPVLPPHFGFAVIEDETGRILYHADDSRVLLENFYDEAERNNKLLTSIRGRHADQFTASYNGKAHRFYVTPMKGLPWSLVVFYDLSLPRTLNFDMGMTASLEAVTLCVLFVSHRHRGHRYSACLRLAIPVVLALARPQKSPPLPFAAVRRARAGGRILCCRFAS